MTTTNAQSSKTPKSANRAPAIGLVALCLFALNIAGYMAFRLSISERLFGADTVNLSLFYLSGYEPSPAAEHSTAETVLKLIKDFPRVASYLLTSREPTRYAPLSMLYTHEIQAYLLEHPNQAWVAMLLTSVLYAGLMTIFFLLAACFIPSLRWALAALFLFQFSIATFQAAYPAFSLPYLLVPFVITSGLYGYLKFKETGRFGFLLVFLGASLAGPWCREFSGAIPFIVIASEAFCFKGSRSWRILALCIPLMIHSLYPGLLMKCLGLNSGKIFSVFEQKNALSQSSGLRFNRTTTGFLFVQFPPLLWILVWASMAICWWQATDTRAGAAVSFSLMGKKMRWHLFASQRLRRILRWGVLAGFLVLLCFAVRAFFIEYPAHPGAFRLRHGVTLLILVALVPLAAFRFHPLLAIYFAAMWVPFLKLRLAELHVCFALVPVAIAATLWLREGARRLQGNPAKMAAAGFIAFLALADHSANLFACQGTQKQLVAFNQEAADWLQQNVRKGSPVIFNFYHLTDIYYYSKGHIDPYDAVVSSPLPPDRILAGRKALSHFLAAERGQKDIYLFAAEADYFPWVRPNQEHPWVRRPPGPITLLKRFKAEHRYFYLDPLKYFVPRFFVSFPGYMDWENNFYFGNEAVPFLRRVAADYALYRLAPLPDGVRKAGEKGGTGL